MDNGSNQLFILARLNLISFNHASHSMQHICVKTPTKKQHCNEFSGADIYVGPEKEYGVIKYSFAFYCDELSDAPVSSLDV